MYAYQTHTGFFNIQVAPIDTEPAFKASANSSLSPTTNGDSRVQLLEKELNGKDDEILKLRAEADMSARKILFLSHYATSMRQDSSRSRSAAKRRLSDLTDRERRLYRRVSDECTKLVTEKVDVEQSQSAQLKTKFQEACADMEESNREIMEKFKTDFLELKEKLFTTIHSPQNKDS